MRWVMALGLWVFVGCGDAREEVAGKEAAGDSAAASAREAFIRERCENAAGSEQGYAYCSENAGKLWDRNNP